MNQADLKKRWLSSRTAKQRFLLVAAYLGLLYGSLPFTRDIVLSLKESALLNSTVTLIYILSGAAVLWFMIVHYRIRDLAAYILMTCISLILAYFVLGLEVPEERIHFVQYGLLGIGVTWWLGTKLAGHRLYLLATMITILLGILDEAIQYLLPMRVFDVRDIMFNTIAAVLGVGFSMIFRMYLIQTDDENTSGG